MLAVSKMTERVRHIPTICWLTGITILGAGLRLYRLGAQSLWADEAFSLAIARLRVPAIIANESLSVHPPLYYFLLHFFVRLDKGEFVARLSAALFGIATVVAIYYLARELFEDSQTALVSAFFWAIFPFAVYYSQEARMYSLLALLVAIATFAFYKALRRRTWRYRAIFVIAMSLSVYTHYFAFFSLVALNLFAFIHWRRYKASLSSLLVSDFLLALLFLPQVLVIPAQVQHVMKPDYWIGRPGNLLKPLTTLYFFVFSYTLQPYVLPFALFVILSIVAIILYQFLRFIRGVERERLSLLLLLTFTPLVMAYLISIALKPIYIERTLTEAAPAYCILLGWGLTRSKKPSFLPLQYGLMLILALVSLGNYYFNVDYAKPPLREVAHYLAAHFEPGDVILHTSDGSYLPFLSYDQPSESYLLIGDPTPHYPLRTHRLFGGRTGTLEEILPGYNRFWLVMFIVADGDIDYELALKEQLDRQYPLLDEEDIRGIKIFLYGLEEEKP
jgi:mannosyltransferase